MSTLQELEARISALEAESSGSEALMPTYLTISPAGLTDASFTGSVLLVEADAQPLQPAHAVGWQDATAIREWVQGYDDGLGFKTLDVTSNPNANDLVRLLLQSQATPNGGTPARLVLVTGDSNGAGHTIATTVLDSNGASGFLQLLSAQRLQLAFGQTTLAWTASNLSATNTINHGLGRAPQLVLATSQGAPGPGEVPALNTFTYTTTQFSINGDARLSGTFNCPVNWVAIG